MAKTTVHGGASNEATEEEVFGVPTVGAARIGEGDEQPIGDVVKDDDKAEPKKAAPRKAARK